VTSEVSYCTLFDSAYLPQGLALYKSLCRYSPGFTLWVLPMDSGCHQFLEDAALPGIRLLELSQVEDQEILAIKANRTHGEYCWTLTPVLIARVLELETQSSLVTYIDADCWLAGPVMPLIDAFLASSADCMITPHFYPEGSKLIKTAGTYCVQFMPFKASAKSFEMLSLWRHRCLQSCSSSLSGSGLGDQIHLEDWPRLFAGHVFVLDQPLLTLAPWNVEHLWTSDNLPLCLYHFQGFRLFRVWSFVVVRSSAKVRLPRWLNRTLLEPYISDVCDSLNQIPSRFRRVRSIPPPWSDPRGYFLFLPRLLLLNWQLKIYFLP